MNIATKFYQSALSNPNKVALREGSKKVTYYQLHKRITTISEKLSKHGISAGDKILLVVPISIEFYAATLAVMSLGAVVVVTDKAFNRKEVFSAYQRANCKLMLTIPLLKILSPIFFKNMKCLVVFKRNKLNQNRLENLIEPIEVSKNDTALITFTSGTTGLPKLANRTHEFLNIQLETLVEKMNISEHSVHSSNLPIVLLVTLASSAETIIAKKGLNQRNNSINLITTSPYYAPTFLSNTYNSELEVFIGGATILPNYAKSLLQYNAKAKIKFVYGSTEVEPIALITLNEYLNLVNHQLGIPVGVVHENLEIKIETILRQGELNIGSILVKGKHVLKNYINGKDIEWLNTGDVGYIENQQLYFLGRKKYCWVVDKKFYSPLLIEKLSISEIVNQTMLKINGQHILFTTHKNETDIIHHKRIQLKEFKFDKRHNSRIDYEWLIKNYS